MKNVLDAVKKKIKELTGGAPVMFDPQPVQIAEPHVRLTYVGCGDQGEQYDVLRFQLNIVAAGDGPDVFLPSLIELSLRIHDIFQKESVYTFALNQDDCRLYIRSSVNAAGQFIQNEQEESERSQFRYTYAEPHMVEVAFPKNIRERRE